MIEIIEKWLAFGARVNAEWGSHIFVLFSYTITCLFSLAIVRAHVLDCRDQGAARPGRLKLIIYAGTIGFVLEAVIAFGLRRMPLLDTLTHAFLGGALVPVVAWGWIKFLNWLGRPDLARGFQVIRGRRAEDVITDDSTTITRGDDTGELRL